uniref:Ataxin-3 homolog n=1 Tax=Macrostomum lignano TaxID=282301 RepID=A0A1I8HQX1_9PLAT
MESVFHEQQDGSLCAQHCLNALLQSSYFTAVDLGAIANEMDQAEREHMAARGVETEEYQQFVQQGSSNMDDSGFFSVQVLASALAVWDLELVPLSKRDHPTAQRARDDPTAVSAYICNFREHWFTIRRLGSQWFNLNSLLSGPELISESYLTLFLAQLRQEGYTIFIVVGSLPLCEADQVLSVTPAVQRERPKLLRAPGRNRSRQGAGSSSAAPPYAAAQDDEAEDDELRRALEISRQLHDSGDVSLQRALAETRPPGAQAAAISDQDLQRALELSRQTAEDDASLQQALALSLLSEDEAFGQADDQRRPPTTTTTTGSTGTEATTVAPVEDLRQRRAKFLDQLEKKTAEGGGGGGGGND